MSHACMQVSSPKQLQNDAGSQCFSVCGLFLLLTNIFIRNIYDGSPITTVITDIWLVIVEFEGGRDFENLEKQNSTYQRFYLGTLHIHSTNKIIDHSIRAVSAFCGWGLFSKTGTRFRWHLQEIRACFIREDTTLCRAEPEKNMTEAKLHRNLGSRKKN